MASMDVEESSLVSKRAKGRGADSATDLADGDYESLSSGTEEKSGGPVKSVEGWIIFLTGVHEEAEEDGLLDRLSDFGNVQNFQLQLDRRTGFVKGYALVEFEKKEEAESAIRGLNDSEFMEKQLTASWAFVAPPSHT
uniref:RRM domain-containing protein n=1 Tax=Vannella robusta TaxID=1487602 RepID=A0A7S4IB91_9EUKA|mmetsp:Transcript_2321/g.2847  ORF Transcript_2321/g.2847 Transcript_2321/m.2847 type:complete len:138 (+) Transcript_2321:2-415(+)